jgi:tetratricopeptide (TPR) repeat protein
VSADAAGRCARVDPDQKGELSMKLGAFVVSASILAASVLGAGCSRNRQEAVILANKGDQEVKVNVDGAINSYEQATHLDPLNHRIFAKLGAAYRKKEDWDKVASTMARAAQLAPKFADYWFWRGYALEQQAKKKTVPWEECKEPLQKCIQNDPNYADCYEELGNAFLWTDDEQKALENYNKAVEHAPEKIAYYDTLADLYLRLGYVKEAETVLKEGKAFIKPDDKAQQKAVYGMHVLLAHVYQERDSLPEAVAELEAAKAVVPQDGPEAVQILWNLGSTYATMKPPRSAEAISMLKGFSSRACKGSKAATYKTECEQSQTLVTKLGGTLR